MMNDCLVLTHHSAATAGTRRGAAGHAAAPAAGGWLSKDLSSAPGPRAQSLSWVPRCSLSPFAVTCQCQSLELLTAVPIPPQGLFPQTVCPAREPRVLHSRTGQGAVAHLPSPPVSRLSPAEVFSSSFICFDTEGIHGILD